MAIALSMLPKKQQDRLYERGTFQELLVGNAAEDNRNYERLVEDLTRICNAKEQQVRPTPLEIGNVGKGVDGSVFDPYGYWGGV